MIRRQQLNHLNTIQRQIQRNATESYEYSSISNQSTKHPQPSKPTTYITEEYYQTSPIQNADTISISKDSISTLVVKK